MSNTTQSNPLNQTSMPKHEHHKVPFSWLLKILNWRDHAFESSEMNAREYESLREKRRKQRLAFCIGAALLVFILAMLVPRVVGHFLYQPIQFKSVSAQFYYSAIGVFFTVNLFVASALMLRYSGESFWESCLSRIGGVGLMLLTFFPVIAKPLCESSSSCADVNVRTLNETWRVLLKFNQGDFTWFSWVNQMHYFGAILLFGSLVLLVFFVFTRWGPNDLINEKRIQQKRQRNVAYYFLGLVMIISLIYFVGDGRDFYIGEMIALSAFFLSWMLKGRFWVSMVDADREVCVS